MSTQLNTTPSAPEQLDTNPTTQSDTELGVSRTSFFRSLGLTAAALLLASCGETESVKEYAQTGIQLTVLRKDSSQEIISLDAIFFQEGNYHLELFHEETSLLTRKASITEEGGVSTFSKEDIAEVSQSPTVLIILKEPIDNYPSRIQLINFK